MTVDGYLTERGFELVQQRRDGSRQYGMRANPYLAYWLLAQPDGTAVLSWEFELGSYLKAKGFSISAQDELSLLLFPVSETQGVLEAGWIDSELSRVEQQLASVDLLRGT